MQEKNNNYKTYINEVVVFPTAIGCALLILIWLIASKFKKIEIIAMFDFVFSLILIMHINRKLKWTKLPDGTYLRCNEDTEIDKVKNPHSIFVKNAQYFEHLFYTSKAYLFKELLLPFFIYLIIIFSGQVILILPAILILVILFYYSRDHYISLFNTKPLIKISAFGIWTRKLGYITFDKLKYATLKEQEDGGKQDLYLKIYLYENYKPFSKDQLLLKSIQNADLVLPCIVKYKKEFDMLLLHLLNGLTAIMHYEKIDSDVTTINLSYSENQFYINHYLFNGNDTSELEAYVDEKNIACNSFEEMMAYLQINFPKLNFSKI